MRTPPLYNLPGHFILVHRADFKSCTTRCAMHPNIFAQPEFAQGETRGGVFSWTARLASIAQEARLWLKLVAVNPVMFLIIFKAKII